MTNEQEIKLFESVAVLTERARQAEKKEKIMDAKLDQVYMAIIQSNADREADLVSLKISLKNKINDSINKLSDYHDADLEPIKEHVRKTGWAAWMYTHPVVSGVIALVILVALKEEFIWVWQQKAEIMDWINAVKS
jgi:hypothetical protein